MGARGRQVGHSCRWRLLRRMPGVAQDADVAGLDDLTSRFHLRWWSAHDPERPHVYLKPDVKS